MVDYVADLKRFVLAGRTVEAIRFCVLGNVKDYVQIGLKDVDVRADGTATVLITADQALAVAQEFTKQAHAANGGSSDGRATSRSCATRRSQSTASCKRRSTA